MYIPVSVVNSESIQWNHSKNCYVISEIKSIQYNTEQAKVEKTVRLNTEFVVDSEFIQWNHSKKSLMLIVEKNIQWDHEHSK